MGGSALPPGGVSVCCISPERLEEETVGISIQVWTQTPEKLAYVGGGATGGGGPLVRQRAFRRDLQDPVAAWLVELQREMLVRDFQSLQAQWALLFSAALSGGEGAESCCAAGG